MESDQFATYVTFTIQNVPIKFNNVFIPVARPRIYNTKCFY